MPARHYGCADAVQVMLPGVNYPERLKVIVGRQSCASSWNESPFSVLQRAGGSGLQQTPERWTGRMTRCRAGGRMPQSFDHRLQSLDHALELIGLG